MSRLYHPSFFHFAIRLFPVLALCELVIAASHAVAGQLLRARLGRPQCCCPGWTRNICLSLLRPLAPPPKIRTSSRELLRALVVPRPHPPNRMDQHGLMSLKCAKCAGDGSRAGEMRSFTYRGQPLHCLTFVSNCETCGHRWVDPLYAHENYHLYELACAAADR